MRSVQEQWFWGIVRISMGWIFFWPFLDKLWGLGFETTADKAWILGQSPTTGFLKFATKGPFAEFYQSLAGNAFVDWIFMLGLLGIGISLLLGVFVKLASWGGALMLVLMYTAGFIPPEHNPFLDDHLIYALLLIGLVLADAGRYLGVGSWWEQTEIVKKWPILK